MTGTKSIEFQEYEAAHSVGYTMASGGLTAPLQQPNVGYNIFLFGTGTTSAQQIDVTNVSKPTVDIPSRLAEIKSMANLTDEELAAILRTTRQTLHNWRNGKAISARREHHVENVLRAMTAVCVDDAEENRRVLLSTREGSISLFDMLVQNRIDDVLSLSAGHSAFVKLLPEKEALATQFDRLEDETVTAKPKIDHNFAGKL